MAGKISELTALTGAAAADTDLIETVDVSDTSMAATGTNKKMTLAELGVKLGGGGGGAVGQTTPTTDWDTLVTPGTWNTVLCQDNDYATYHANYYAAYQPGLLSVLVGADPTVVVQRWQVNANAAILCRVLSEGVWTDWVQTGMHSGSEGQYLGHGQHQSGGQGPFWGTGHIPQRDTLYSWTEWDEPQYRTSPMILDTWVADVGITSCPPAAKTQLGVLSVSMGADSSVVIQEWHGAADAAGAVRVYSAAAWSPWMTSGNAAQTIKTEAGATYSVVAADSGKLVRLTGTATITLPSGELTTGQRVDFVCIGGAATFALGSGATWDVAPTPSAVARAIGSFVTAIKMGAAAWALTGDLA